MIFSLMVSIITTTIIIETIIALVGGTINSRHLITFQMDAVYCDDNPVILQGCDQRLRLNVAQVEFYFQVRMIDSLQRDDEFFNFLITRWVSILIQ